MTARKSTDMENQPEAENDDRNDSRSPAKKRSAYGFILALAAVAIGLIVYLNSQKGTVRPERPKPKPTVDYSALIQVHADQASYRNLNALKMFEIDVNRVRENHERKLLNAARKGAKEAADYASCCKIVYYLAWDKVKGKNETEAYLNQEIKPFVDPAIRALGGDLDSAVRKLEYELSVSTVQYAKDLLAVNPSGAGRDLDVDVDVDTMSRLDIQQSLRNLGFNATVIAVSVAFDAVALYESRLAAALLKKISSIAARMFGKQVVKVAALPVVALADGPLPVGDIIAGVGLIWTGYEIYASRKEFEKEINTSLRNLVGDASNSVHEQALEHGTAMMKQYQKLQDEIGSQTLGQIAKGRN